jgi:hypothetical protein
LGGGDRRDERLKPDVDEVDIGDGKCDVPHQDDASVQQPIEKIDQGHVALGPPRLVHVNAPGTKL